MDAWVLNLRSGGLSGFGPMRKHEKSSSVAPRGTGAGWIDARVSVRGRRPSSAPRNHRSMVVRARGKKKNDQGSHSSSDKNLRFHISFVWVIWSLQAFECIGCFLKSGRFGLAGKNDQPNQEEDDLDGATSRYEGSKSNDFSDKSHHILSDWRDFRANLVAWEKEQLLVSDAVSKGTASHESSQRLGLKWAHPIPVPETGCMLVATEKLDGVPNFERTVILLLKLGSRGPREGPFGIILNRPLHRKIKHMKPSNSDLATIFSDCSVHCGGPLEANMFLLRSGENTSLPGFEKVVSDVCFGARNNLHEAAALVKQGVFTPQDFRFFVGYAGWQYDQLLDEIESEYWVAAACSSNLIFNGATSDSSSNLWEEILQLMGGQYSDLSRKPKRDNP